MVHMPFVERIGLADSRIPIVVLVLRALVGVVSHLPALVTLNLAKVPLCIHHLTVLVVVPSIAIAIAIVISMLVPIVVVVAIMIVAITPTMIVSIATMMIMSMIMSSIPIIGSTLLLLWSRAVLATVVVVLPLAVLNGLLFAFQHNGFVNEPLAVSKSSHSQLDSQLII